MTASASNTTPALSESEALQVVSRGVSREIRTESQRTTGYCSDAVKLQGHNVRKLAQKLEIRAEEKGEKFNADSYMSNISNANGIMGLFGFDIDEFTKWLETSDIKSLSAIYKAFRKLFVDPKPKQEKAPKEQSSESENIDESTPFDVVTSMLPHLSQEELVKVLDMIEALTVTPEAELAQAS